MKYTLLLRNFFELHTAIPTFFFMNRYFFPFTCNNNNREEESSDLPACRISEMVSSLVLKSIRIHLAILISAITCSILDQFQNFKHQQLANYLRFMMVLFIKIHSLPVKS